MSAQLHDICRLSGFKQPVAQVVRDIHVIEINIYRSCRFEFDSHSHYRFRRPYPGTTYTLVASRNTVVRAYIPYRHQLHVDSDRAQIFIYYSRGYLRLSYTYRSYDSLSFYRARPVQLDTDDCYLSDLYRCISGRNCGKQR